MSFVVLHFVGLCFLFINKHISRRRKFSKLQLWLRIFPLSFIYLFLLSFSLLLPVIHFFFSFFMVFIFATFIFFFPSPCAFFSLFIFPPFFIIFLPSFLHSLLSPFVCLPISCFSPQPHSLVYCYVFQTPC